MYNRDETVKWFVVSLAMSMVSLALGVIVGAEISENDCLEKLNKVIYAQTNDYLEHQYDTYDDSLREVKFRLKG